MRLRSWIPGGWWLAAVVAALVASSGSTVISAATNDLRENAVAVTTSPFVHNVDTSAFNSQAYSSDPEVECGGEFLSGNPPVLTRKQTHTAWYKLTPLTAGGFSANTLGSENALETVVALWTTTQSGAPDSLVACNKDKLNTSPAYSEIPDFNDIHPEAHNLVAGKTYLLEVMSYQSTPGGMVKLTVTFDGLLAPTISTLSPAGAETGSAAPLAVTVTGEGFIPGSTVAFGAANITPSAVTPTSVTFQLQQAHLATGGVRDVVVKSPDGVSSAPAPFTVYSRPTTEPGTLWLTRGRGTVTIAISGTGFEASLTSGRIGTASRAVVVSSANAAMLTLAPTDEDVLGTLEVRAANAVTGGPELISTAAATLIVRSRADTTCDPIVDADDALRALQLLAGMQSLPIECDAALNPDGAGGFDLADAIFIRRVVAGLADVP